MSWNQRLNEVFTQTGWSKAELSRRSGVPYDNVNKYLAGRVEKPRGNTLPLLARALNVDPLWLEHGVEPELMDVPVLSMVSASNLRDQPGVTQADIDRWIRVADLPRGDWVALAVEGDSMNLIAPDGSIILVNRADDVLIDGRYYIFSVSHGAATFKRYRRNPDRLQPYSTNPDHPSIPVDGDLYVFGRVRRVIHDL